MARLSKVELAQHRAWLSEWRAPAAMASYVSEINRAMGSADFFSQGGIAFLRDAWLAAEFGKHRESAAVQLIADNDQWPDFRAETDGAIESIECVEADIPGRRRGDEYRSTICGQTGADIVDDPVEDWIARANSIPSALSAAIDKKIGKQYTGSAGLLVHLNIAEFGIRQLEIKAAMGPAIAPALPCFQHIWILWKERLYGPWVGSERARSA